MSQSGDTLSWSSLLDSKGRPHHDITTTILRSLRPFGDILEVPRKPGALFLVHRDRGILIYGFSEVDLGQTVARMHKRLNGTSVEYDASIVELPSGRSFKATEKVLRSVARRHNEAHRFGQEVYERLLSHRRSYIMIANIMTHIPFDVIAHRKDGEVALEPLLCGQQAAGIYFVREHRPGSSYGEVVYVGMSVGRLAKTAKDHFRTWKGKDHPTYEVSRGEDRGKWLQKIAKGYRYDIGTVVFERPKELSEAAFRIAVLKIEAYFIHALNPRDNFMKKQEHPEHNESLFDAAHAPAPPPPPDDDDPVPF